MPEKHRDDHAAFMQRALEEAAKALNSDEFPVGCVLVCDGAIVATGARRGTAPGSSRPNEIDHAEMVALRRFYELGDGIDPVRTTLYCTMEPCLMCYGAILLSGIAAIVYAYEDVMGGGTACSLDHLLPLYRNRRIEVVPGVMRTESLALFKQFFSNPEQDYWRGSQLAEYTLAAR